MIDLQMDNRVDGLTSDGYIKKIGSTKVYLTDDGRRQKNLEYFILYTFRIGQFVRRA
jgi:hypothetical protein